MIGLLFEIKDQMDKKKSIEEEIRLLKCDISRKIVIKELDELYQNEKRIIDKLDSVRIKIKCIENDMKIIDRDINIASSKLYGFGISDCDMLNISKKIEELNRTKVSIYEELMKNMDIVRRLSSKRITIRDEIKISKDRLMEIDSEIDEKVIALNKKLKKVEKNIKKNQVAYSSEVIGGDYMKTWEMIKHLEEEPDTIFVNKRLSKEKPLLTLKFIEGILSWTEDGINPYDSEFSISKMLIADEWDIKR